MTKEDILERLKEVRYPGFSKDIVFFNFVETVDLLESNGVAITLVIPSSSTQIANELKESITQTLANELTDIKQLEIIIKVAENKDEKRDTPPKKATNTSPQGRKNIAPNIQNFLMVSSGKGGVGKSTTSLNIAVSLAMQGKRVGLLDADIYGPNIPRMVGLQGEQPTLIDRKKFRPFEVFGVTMMSMGSLLEEGQSVIWRGAMIMKVITQLLQDVAWGELDVLVIDMPPGTGDAQLTLAQSVPITSAIVVTTPQMVALDDSKRSLDMFQKLNIPIGGIVENMSSFVCPSCNEESSIFDTNTTQKIAEEFGTKMLSQIPIEPLIREGGDSGKPITYFHPESKSAKNYMRCADEIWEHITTINDDGGVSNDEIQPTEANGKSSKGGGCGPKCGCG